MTNKSKSPRAKRDRPIPVSNVLWAPPVCIFAVATEAARDAILRRYDVPPAHWETFLRHPTDSSAPDAEAEVQYYNGGSLIIVCFGPHVLSHEALGTEAILTITHEAVHIFQRVCEFLGEESPGREVEAYAIENITRNLIDAFVALKEQFMPLKEPFMSLKEQFCDTNAPKATEQDSSNSEAVKPGIA
jgi:hypothetical protein